MRCMIIVVITKTNENTRFINDDFFHEFLNKFQSFHGFHAILKWRKTDKIDCVRIQIRDLNF